MGAHWIVHEGYLQFKEDRGNDPRPPLVERYVVLYMNRKIEMFENANKEPAERIGSCYVRAFCGWDGDGLLKAGESYGLELKLEKHAASRLFVAAFNRLDLEKWCRGFVAVLDPDSAAGQEVRRERRKAKKEEKRAQEEREEKIRLWKEQQRKMREDEILRLQQREEEIQNMTPLERIDGLGEVDDDTARMLEKRRQRQQRRQAPTTRRVNKAAFRQRLDDAAGGKLENLQPLQAKPVQEQRGKVRVEAPAPGQYIEASGAAATRRSSNPTRRRRLDSTDGSGSDSDFSRDSRVSSGPFSSGSRSGSIPPPPPPRSEFDDSRSDFIPPPPPPMPGSRRGSRSQSLRGSLYGEMERHSELSSSRLPISQSSRRLSGVEREQHDVQASLATILGGRKIPPRGKDDVRSRRDSFESTADSTANGDGGSVTRAKKANGASGETSMTNAFAASLAAIRRNRADTMEDSNSVDIPSARKRDRKRDSQLSAEGKAILQKAISIDEPSTPVRKKETTNGGRKGLFDDSSSDDDSDAGLFGLRKSTAAKGRERPSEVNERPSTKAGRRGIGDQAGELSASDDDDSHDLRSKQSAPSDYTSPRSATSPVSGARATGNFYAQPKSLDVVYKSGVLQNQGKKAVVVYMFSFRSGNAEHSFSRSYHEFEEIHQRLSTEALPRLPKFPSKHLLRNFTKPENMQKRAMEFVQYFQALVAIPGIMNNKRFLFEFDISDDFVRVALGDGGPSTAPISMPTPTSTRTPKPSGATIGVTPNGGKSRATALFGADDTDSDAESVSIPLSTPKKPVQPAPEAEPRKKKSSKPSRKELDMEEPVPTSGRRDRTRSRTSVKSIADAKPAEPLAPKITGLPARPILFGGGRGDLLAAIRQGATLKKVDGDEAAPAPAGRGVAFPAPSGAPPPPPPPRPAPLTNAGSVAEAINNAMAARRIHVEYEDDKSDDDSDDDWD